MMSWWPDYWLNQTSSDRIISGAKVFKNDFGLVHLQLRSQILNCSVKTLMTIKSTLFPFRLPYQNNEVT